MTDDPLDALFAAASAARENAHVPYSRYKVGVAIRTTDGRVFAGCNVENAAYPQSQCAEASAIGAMVTAGATGIAELLLIGGSDGDKQVITPCGGCRQRILEFARPDTPIHLCTPSGLRGTVPFESLLPMAFSNDALR